MKKILSLVLILLMMTMLVSGVTVMAEGQKVVTVSSAQELINAIASDTKIIIEEGNYVANAGWIGNVNYGMRTGIRIENIENLTIEAKGNVEIKLDIGYCPVFEVENSNNISFIGLSLGHDVPQGSCEGEGDVISAFDSQNITIDNCDLWGCGIVGIWTQGSGNINVTNTTIRDCENSAVVCYMPTGNMILDNCKVLRNNYGVEGEPSDWDVCFRWSPRAADDVKLTVKNSVIEGNYSGKLMDDQYYDKSQPSKKIEFVNCTFNNNAWDKNGEVTTQQPETYEPAPEVPAEEYYEEPKRYSESVISVSGITGYDESRVVMYDNVVAMCSAPVVIEAKTNLTHISIVKLENINGEWVDTRYFEGYAINQGDINKNWMPAEGFENVDEDLYEFTGGDIEITGEDMFVEKGKTVSLSEKGMYQVWADAENGDYTGLTFEIVDSNATYSAKYTDSKVMVDGRQVQFEAYNIADNNYFKLRDIAYVLSGTLKQFEVEWDAVNERVNMISFAPYTAVGGELAAGDGLAKTATNGTSNISKDGKPVALKAYMINGNNYFKLRDLGKLFDFDVSWDGENNCVLIDSESYYTED